LQRLPDVCAVARPPARTAGIELAALKQAPFAIKKKAIRGAGGLKAAGHRLVVIVLIGETPAIALLLSQ
jgi:hypothetical protein